MCQTKATPPCFRADACDVVFLAVHNLSLSDHLPADAHLPSRLPWDPVYLVESLSDSTIYMAYYAGWCLHGTFVLSRGAKMWPFPERRCTRLPMSSYLDDSQPRMP